MDLATRIGANPAKALSRSNVSFLGKGPTKNPLFQNRLAGLENASPSHLGDPKRLFGAIEDAVGWAKDGKLNSIQTEILGHNLSGIERILHPPPLPTASVTAIRPGIEGLRRFPKETHKFFGRPLKGKDFTDIDKLVKEGVIDRGGRQWNFTRLPETGPGAFTKVLNQKTGMSRAIARQILQQDTRLKLPEEVLISLRTGSRGPDPLDLMKKYYGRSMENFDDFLNNVNLQAGSPRDLATRVLSEVELLPQFAEGGRIGFGSGGNGGVHSLMPELDALTWKSLEGPLSAAEKDRMELLIELTGVLDKFKGSFAEGGLADVLQVRSGYSKGRLVKGALAILNRNKKNAEYMFKASDNVSPGYARGDIKYNAELLADQLAEDAGVLYEDLGQLDQIKFYGTAYDYLAKEMGQYRQMTKMLKDVEQKMQLSDFSIKGRKPSASGGLARILEL